MLISDFYAKHMLPAKPEGDYACHKLGSVGGWCLSLRACTAFVIRGRRMWSMQSAAQSFGIVNHSALMCRCKCRHKEDLIQEAVKASDYL